MYGQKKFDVPKALTMREQGLGNVIIAKRLGVTYGTISLAFRKYDAEHGTPENLKPRRRTTCWA
ncbi:MAG: hypothetical protein ACYC9J_06790 [Sulfuricaulis sp.]